MDKEQQTISIPWIITDGKLLVSPPGGGLFEYDVTDRQAGLLPSFLSNEDMWQVFFNSAVEASKVV